MRSKSRTTKHMRSESPRPVAPARKRKDRLDRSSEAAVKSSGNQTPAADALPARRTIDSRRRA